MNTVTEQFKSGGYETDKHDHGYLVHIYNQLFADRRKVTKVLEIGIKTGGSLKLWRDWFVNAVIHGVDITPCPSLENEPRIVTHVKDAYCDEFLDGLANDFDVIIDDGPHTFESMIYFVTKYIHKIKPGGVLVLEDIIDPTWTPKIIERVPPNFETTVYNMGDKQRSDHLSRRWSTVLDVLSSFWLWSKSRPLLNRIVKGLDVFHLHGRLHGSTNLVRLQRHWSKGLDVLVVKKYL